MDKQTIANKLTSLQRCLVRIHDRTPESSEQLAHDYDAQDIISLNLTRAIQLCVDIGSHILSTSSSNVPASMGQTFDQMAGQGLIAPELALRMRKAVGFRNVAVHNYDEIDWEIVYSIIRHHMNDFDEFFSAISALL